jgi:hypothetical protein
MPILEWIRDTFGEHATTDVEERALRFGEEVIELTQTDGITKEQWLALIDQVYAKPAGETFQELGGVCVTFEAYNAVTQRDPRSAYLTEWERVNTPEMKAKIKAKHDTKAVVSSKSERNR